MKTQRPRDRAVPKPRDEAIEPDDNGNSNGSSKVANGSTNGHPSTTNSAVASAPPALPRRRVRGNESTAVATAPAAKEVSSPEPVQTAHSEHPSVAPEEPPRPSQPKWRALITYENALWLAIFAIAIFTRFYDIGDRALHHDESLHSVYSGNLYTGVGYTHDPMMHGPLQFHLIAFMYWLFGRTDATVRFASAVCGLIVVMSPFFMRKQMGRVAALVAGFLFLVSPSILYFSRMAREDAIFSGMEMIMIIGLWRFLSTRKPMDFYIFCAGLSLMFTIKETTYLTLAVLGVLFIGLFALQSGYAILGALVGYLVVLGGVARFIMGQMPHTNSAGQVIQGTIPKLPDIPQTSPDFETIKNFAINFLTHPLILAVMAVTLVFVAVVAALFYVQRNRVLEQDAAGSEHDDGTGHALPVRKLGSHHGVLRPNAQGILAHYEPGSLPYILGALLARPMVLLIGFGVFSTIFVVFYTVFFTDVPRGILSGMFASLGYWIAQQGVARGGQPWFYYLLLLPLYEPIAIFFSMAGAVLFSWKGIQWLRRNREEQIVHDERRLGLFNLDRPVPFARFEALMPLFLGWWLVGAIAIYSWAGEKMPWLMIHMVRPAILLASLVIAALIFAIVEARKSRLRAAEDEEAAPLTSLPTRSRRAVGATFSLFGGKQPATGPIAGRQLALEAAGPVPATMQYKTNGAAGGGRGTATVPGRRTAARAAAVALPAQAYQEPPWVSWNKPGSVAPFAIYLSIFVLLAFAWGLSLSQMTHWANDPANSLIDHYASWGVTWLYPIAMVALTVGFAIWIGVGRSLRYLAVGIFSVMLVYQFHSGVQLTYRNMDTATEMAVYVQTSPDVTRAMKELHDFSVFTTGGTDVKVIYDSETSWPLEWYLRDYKNKQFIGGSAPNPGPDVPVMFLDYKYLNDPNITKDYVAQRYALRWWFPEEWYKGTASHDGFLPNQYVRDANGTIVTDPATGQQKEAGPLAQFGDGLHTAAVTVLQPEYEATLWKYLLYKEPPKALGSTDFVMFVRKDVAQLWHNLQNQPPNSANIP